jgi:hypothetical protein
MPETPKKIRCADGPYGDRKVSSKLGDRWPYVTYFDGTNWVLGYYELDKGTGEYRWDSDSIERGGIK